MAIASEHDPKDGIAVINCQEKKPIVLCRFLPNVDTHTHTPTCSVEMSLIICSNAPRRKLMFCCLAWI